MGAGASTQVKSIGEDEHITSELPPSKQTSAKKNTETSKTFRTVPNNDDITNVKSSPSTVTKVMKMKPAPSTSSLVLSSSTASTSKGQQSSSAHTDLEIKVEQLEKELAEKQSERLDHLDQIQALEERVQELTSVVAAPNSTGDEDIGKTLKAKDLYIRQLEQQLETEQAESKKVRIRLKKKIKTLTTQLSEAKQESSIAQLEMKERNESLQNELHSSKAESRTQGATSQDDKEDKESKMKIILDLSAELSDQVEKISMLEQQLKERDRKIEQLKDAVKQASKAAQLQGADHSLSQQHHGDPRDRMKRGSSLAEASQHYQNNRQGMSYSGSRLTTSVTPVESAVGDYHSKSHPDQRGQRPNSKIGPRPGNPPAASSEFTLQRQSTALSDSDSDWEMDEDPNKIRSAPARMRVKSAVMIPEEKSQNGSDIDDKWSLVTDDNDLLLTGQARPSKGGVNRNKRKSALKTKLERERNERARGLLGPSLAFAQPAGDQLTDTSCNNTPSATPRVKDSSFHYGTVTLAV